MATTPVSPEMEARLKRAGVENTRSKESAKAELIKKIEREYRSELESKHIETLLEMVEVMMFYSDVSLESR